MQLKRTLALVLGLWLSCAASAAAQVTAIKAGRLVDPQAGTVLNDQIILIRDNKVEAGRQGPCDSGRRQSH